MSVKFRVLRAADHRRTPWKNGGGATAEIAAYPPRSSLESFDWRVSMADVGQDGPFSLFPGIDRTLVLLDGKGIRLAVDGRARETLVIGAPPFAFNADVAASAVLVDGPVRDLNVMTRRGMFRHSVQTIQVTGSKELQWVERVALFVVGVGHAHVPAIDATVLTPGDALIIESDAIQEQALAFDGNGVLHQILISPVR